MLTSVLTVCFKNLLNSVATIGVIKVEIINGFSSVFNSVKMVNCLHT